MRKVTLILQDKQPREDGSIRVSLHYEEGGKHYHVGVRIPWPDRVVAREAQTQSMVTNQVHGLVTMLEEGVDICAQEIAGKDIMHFAPLPSGATVGTEQP